MIRLWAGTPADVTDAARTASVPPPTKGAYIAVPIMVKVLDDKVRNEQAVTFPDSLWSPAHGRVSFRANVAIPGYPLLEAGSREMPVKGVMLYYDIFDVAPGSLTCGSFEMLMYPPAGGEAFVRWGPETALTEHFSTGGGSVTPDPSQPGSYIQADDLARTPERPIPFGAQLVLQSQTGPALVVSAAKPLNVGADVNATLGPPKRGTYIIVRVGYVVYEKAAVTAPDGEILPPGGYWRTSGGEVIEPRVVAVDSADGLPDPGLQLPVQGQGAYMEVFDVPTDGPLGGEFALVYGPPYTDRGTAYWGAATK